MQIKKNKTTNQNKYRYLKSNFELANSRTHSIPGRTEKDLNRVLKKEKHFKQAWILNPIDFDPSYIPNEFLIDDD